jgi:hypothetical protein
MASQCVCCAVWTSFCGLQPAPELLRKGTPLPWMGALPYLEVRSCQLLHDRTEGCPLVTNWVASCPCGLPMFLAWQFVRIHGIQQFINVFNNVKSRQNDCLKWGDEVRFFGWCALFPFVGARVSRSRPCTGPLTDRVPHSSVGRV